MAKKKKPIKVFHRKLGRERAHGQAFVDYRIIEIDERITGKEYLNVAIHEVFHLQNPKWPEIQVLARADELADILWDIGFRWCDVDDRSDYSLLPKKRT